MVTDETIRYGIGGADLMEGSEGWLVAKRSGERPCTETFGEVTKSSGSSAGTVPVLGRNTHRPLPVSHPPLEFHLNAPATEGAASVQRTR